MNDKDWAMMIMLKQCSSLSSAAEKLFVSQPALSKRIHNLEDEFQIRLISRTKHGVQLTQSGERLYQYSLTMTEELRRIKNELLELREDRKILRIGTAIMFSQFILPNLINSFTSKYPDIYPNIRTGLSIRLSELLKQHEIQLAFIRGDYKISGYCNYFISQDPLCIISKTPIDIHQLPSYPRIEYDTEPSLIQQINLWLDEWFPHQKIHTGMRVGDSQTCISLVSQGGGYAIIPYYVISSRNHPDLCVNFLRTKDGSVVTRATCFLYSQKEYEQLESVRLFVDYVKQYFPENPQQEF